MFFIYRYKNFINIIEIIMSDKYIMNEIQNIKQDINEIKSEIKNIKDNITTLAQEFLKVDNKLSVTNDYLRKIYDAQNRGTMYN